MSREDGINQEHVRNNKPSNRAEEIYLEMFGDGDKEYNQYFSNNKFTAEMNAEVNQVKFAEVTMDRKIKEFSIEVQKEMETKLKIYEIAINGLEEFKKSGIIQEDFSMYKAFQILLEKGYKAKKARGYDNNSPESIRMGSVLNSLHDLLEMGMGKETSINEAIKVLDRRRLEIMTALGKEGKKI